MPNAIYESVKDSSHPADAIDQLLIKHSNVSGCLNAASPTNPSDIKMYANMPLPMITSEDIIYSNTSLHIIPSDDIIYSNTL